MQALEKWLQKKRHWSDNFVSFHQALLSSSIIPYAIYRMRYFVCSQLVFVMVHVIEFYLLTVIFSFQKFVYLVLLRAIILLINSAWWGALEVLRSRVRAFYNMRLVSRIKYEIICWTLLAAIIAIIPLSVSIYYFASLFSNLSQQESVLNLFIACIFFETSLKIVEQVLHDGIYALHRVMRPVMSIIAPQLVYLVFIIVSWPLLEAYSLPVGYFLSASLYTCVSLYYIFRSYSVYKLLPDKFPSKQRIIIFFKNICSAELFMAAAAYLSIGMEGLLIWLIFYTGISADPSYQQGSMFLLFYLILPLVSASSSWSRLFYFDFKKQQVFLKYFLQKFHMQLFSLSLGVGLLCWMLSSFLLLGYFGVHAFHFSLILLGFFLLKSLISYQQIYAFCYRKYLSIIISSLFIVVGFVSMLLIKQLVSMQLLVLIFFMGLSFIYINRLKPQNMLSIDKIASKVMLPFLDWLTSLKAVKTPVTVAYLSLSSKTTTQQKRAFLTAFTRELRENGKATLVSTNQIFYYQETSKVKTVLDNIWFAINGAGLVTANKILPLYQNGQMALKVIYEQELLLPSKQFSAKSISLISHDVNELIRYFKEYFPYGACIYQKYEESNLQYINNNSTHTDILYQIIGFLNSPLDINNGAKQSVTMVHDDKFRPVIFIIPRSYENRLMIKTWVGVIYRYMLFKSIPSLGSVA